MNVFSPWEQSDHRLHRMKAGLHLITLDQWFVTTEKIFMSQRHTTNARQPNSKRKIAVYMSDVLLINGSAKMALYSSVFSSVWLILTCSKAVFYQRMYQAYTAQRPWHTKPTLKSDGQQRRADQMLCIALHHHANIYNQSHHTGYSEQPADCWDVCLLNSCVRGKTTVFTTLNLF